MTNEKFNQILQSRQDKIKSILKQKAKEYSTNGDRLDNFRKGSEAIGCNAQTYLYALMTKHLVCVRELAAGVLPNTEDIVNEKIGDSINYLILLEALLEEERNENN